MTNNNITIVASSAQLGKKPIIFTTEDTENTEDIEG
jgi:hypothetical protein